MVKKATKGQSLERRQKKLSKGEIGKSSFSGFQKSKKSKEEET